MSRPIPLLIIQRAREIIGDQERWCRGSLARGKAGASVSIHDSGARRYCAMGALMLAASELCPDDAEAGSLAYAVGKIISPTGSLVFVNDYQGRAAVLALFDAAIASYAE
jgi:hypothetical protein